MWRPKILLTPSRALISRLRSYHWMSDIPKDMPNPKSILRISHRSSHCDKKTQETSENELTYLRQHSIAFNHRIITIAYDSHRNSLELNYFNFTFNRSHRGTPLSCLQWLHHRIFIRSAGSPIGRTPVRYDNGDCFMPRSRWTRDLYEALGESALGFRTLFEELVSESITDEWLSPFMLIDDDDKMSHYAQKRIALLECSIFGILLSSLPHTELPKFHRYIHTDVVSMALSFDNSWSLLTHRLETLRATAKHTQEAVTITAKSSFTLNWSCDQASRFVVVLRLRNFMFSRIYSRNLPLFENLLVAHECLVTYH